MHFLVKIGWESFVKGLAVTIQWRSLAHFQFPIFETEFSPDQQTERLNWSKSLPPTDCFTTNTAKRQSWAQQLFWWDQAMTRVRVVVSTSTMTMWFVTNCQTEVTVNNVAINPIRNITLKLTTSDWRRDCFKVFAHRLQLNNFYNTVAHILSDQYTIGVTYYLIRQTFATLWHDNF